MNIQGTMSFDKATNLYAVALPMLGIWTQGKDINEGFIMAKDALRMMYPELTFELYWENKTTGSFGVSTVDKAVVPIILKEARLASGMSLMEVAKRLGYSNQNSIYAYESGIREPSVSKFQELLGVYGISIEMGKAA
jgi:hypothetical protein